MQDIAREAGYTAASLYTYFKSKQEIVDAMVTLLTDEYIRVFDEPIPSALSFRQRFELVLQRQLELAEKRHYIFVGFLSDHTNESMCASDETGRAFHDNFERRIERLATRAELAAGSFSRTRANSWSRSRTGSVDPAGARVDQGTFAPRRPECLAPSVGGRCGGCRCFWHRALDGHGQTFRGYRRSHCAFTLAAAGWLASRPRGSKAELHSDTAGRHRSG